ncbi:hypothetical protein BD779DRAFT_132562 [Infundibulicybe gibba]|nr:hypothetical protein BD779DRAFT_132562 [Infundibulicybe gibba]
MTPCVPAYRIYSEGLRTRIGEAAQIHSIQSLACLFCRKRMLETSEGYCNTCGTAIMRQVSISCAFPLSQPLPSTLFSFQQWHPSLSVCRGLGSHGILPSLGPEPQFRRCSAATVVGLIYPLMLAFLMVSNSAQHRSGAPTDSLPSGSGF